MKRFLAAATAAAALMIVAGAAHAANVCVWTGFDWACGDGKDVFPQHFSEAQGPNMPIVPRQTLVMPAREPTLFSPPGR